MYCSSPLLTFLVGYMTDRLEMVSEVILLKPATFRRHLSPGPEARGSATAVEEW